MVIIHRQQIHLLADWHHAASRHAGAGHDFVRCGLDLLLPPGEVPILLSKARSPFEKISARRPAGSSYSRQLYADPSAKLRVIA